MEIFSTIPSWLLTTILVLSMFWIYLYTLKPNKSSKAVYKHPPNPPKLPLIGNMHQLLGKPRHLALRDLSQKHGPILQLYIGERRLLIISSSDMAKEVLKDQDHIFCSRPFSKATERLTYNYSDFGFAPHGNHWRKMRKVFVSEFLGPKKAKLFNHVLLTEVETMVRSVAEHPSDMAVNLSKLFLETVKEVVCKAAFGSNYRKQPLKGPSLHAVLEDCLDVLNGSLGDYFPWFGQIMDLITGWDRKLEKSFSNLDAYIETLLDEHQFHTIGHVNDDYKDFLQTLLELSSTENGSDDDGRLTREEIKAIIMDIFFGGLDTAVETLVWAMSEITRSPRVMQKLQSEIRNCVGKKQKVDELDVSKMAYLKMVVKETLRLHPPVSLLLPHQTLAHSQIGGYDVLPDTMVLVNAWVIGRDPNTWGKNAADFYPERFENLEVDYRGGNFEMVPFGGGRRTCPALKTAPVIIEVTIANLLYSYDWKVPAGVKNEDLNMQEEGSLIVHKKIPLCLVPTKHNWED